MVVLRPNRSRSPSPELRSAARRTAGGARRRAKRRRMAADDLLRLRSVASPRLSPDGRNVVFVVKHVGEKNEYATNLWMAEVGGEPQPFTSGNKDSAPVWSPDGRDVAFLSARTKGRPQIAVIPVGGGEARDLTDFPEGTLAGLKWSPDGQHLGVLFREQDPDWTEAAVQAREEQGLCDPPRVIDDPWYRLDGDGYFNAQRFHLYVVDAESGEAHVVYDQDRIGTLSYDFSPDGRRIALTTDRDPMAFAKGWNAELLVVDVASGRIRELRRIPVGPKLSVAWSPDGKRLAWAGNEDPDGQGMADNVDLWICDAATGRARNLTGRQDHCLLAPTLSDTAEVEFTAALRWSPDSRRVWMQIGWHGETHVASVATRGGEIVFHTKGRKQHTLGNLSDDGRRIAMIVETAERPGDVHVADVPARRGTAAPGALTPKRVSAVNRDLLAELELSAPKSKWVRSADGTRVQMWTMLPPGASAKRKHPTVLEIHGGPQAQYGWSFFHEFQVLAAAGYAVVYSNPRGSKGYGRKHAADSMGDWGNLDWADLEAVLAETQAQPWVDRSRIGVMGGSFGGYMTLWAIGHTRAFRAAIADRCVANMVSMWGSSDISLWPDTYFPGNTWDDTTKLWSQSPLKYLGNAKTPTLLIHSEGDLRCNVAESEQAYTALITRGVPTRFVRYPRNTSHGMSRSGPPDMRLHRLGQITAWWDRWLKGKRKTKTSRKKSAR